MLLSDWRVVLRRWYAVVLGLLATVALCVGAATVVPERYTTISSVLMLPPETRVDGVPVNPYLNLGGLEGMADVVSTALSDTGVQQALAETGSGAEYMIGRDPSLAGPIVVVTVTGDTPDEALATQSFLLERFPERLDGLQQAAGVPRPARITSTVITEDAEAEVTRRSQTRALLVAGVAGLAGTYLAAAALDGILLARARRRDAKGPGAAPPLFADEPAPGPTSEPARTAAPARTADAGTTTETGTTTEPVEVERAPDWATGRRHEPAR